MAHFEDNWLKTDYTTRVLVKEVRKFSIGSVIGFGELLGQE